MAHLRRDEYITTTVSYPQEVSPEPIPVDPPRDEVDTDPARESQIDETDGEH